MTLEELDALVRDTADAPLCYRCTLDCRNCKRNRALRNSARDLIAIARAAQKASEIGTVDATGPEMQSAVLRLRAALVRLNDGGKEL